jgi:hypothetical protein
MRARKERTAMRFSIVFDDNGTTLAATGGDEAADVLTRGSNDMSDAEPHPTVERVLIDMDANALTHLPARREAEDGPHC